jgi:hypothetical protein
MRTATILLVLTVSTCLGQPTISNVTNAAFPSLDLPPNQVILGPRSIATIFGTDLADSTVAIAPPWQTSLGGTEVHLVVSFCESGDCEITTQLLFASPTQINFLTPYISGGEEVTSVVFIRDGVRYDNQYALGDPGPGLITIMPGCQADCSVVFEQGFDCLYSFSESDPSACGLSWTQGPNRAPVGAVTDPTGALISASNPVHQGEVIVLWMTGLTPLAQAGGGEYLQSPATPVGFGVSQLGQDIPSTLGYSPNGGYAGAFFTPVPLFAGESPQFPGLDQVNVQFPTCPSETKATSESRYDAWLPYASFITGTTVRIYLPFVVRAGDPDCAWSSTTPNPPAPSPTTTTTLASTLQSSGAVTFTATVSPSSATGTVDFADGSCSSGCILIGSAPLTDGVASISGALTEGPHSISALYEGNSYYTSSSSAAVSWTGTSVSLTSSSNPASSGQPIAFTAAVSPTNVSGNVSFVAGGLPIVCSGGTVPVIAGIATCDSPGLDSGTFTVSATYLGNAQTDIVGSSASITETVQ